MESVGGERRGGRGGARARALERARDGDGDADGDEARRDGGERRRAHARSSRDHRRRRARRRAAAGARLPTVPPHGQPRRQPDRAGRLFARRRRERGQPRPRARRRRAAERPLRRLGLLGARAAPVIDSVEVLRGGASDLYGSSALGGVVNVLTRGVEDRPALAFEASYGTQRTLDGSLFVERSQTRLGRESRRGVFPHGRLLPRRTGRARRGGHACRVAHTRRSTSPSSAWRATAFASSRAAPTSARRATTARGSNATARTSGRPSPAPTSHATESARSPFARTSARRSSTRASPRSRTTARAKRSRATSACPRRPQGFSLNGRAASALRHALVAGFEAREVRGASDELVYVAGRASTLGRRGRQASGRRASSSKTSCGSRRSYVDGGRALRPLAQLRRARTTAPLFGPATTNAFADRTESAFSPRASLLYKRRALLAPRLRLPRLPRARP